MWNLIFNSVLHLGCLRTTDAPFFFSFTEPTMRVMVCVLFGFEPNVSQSNFRLREVCGRIQRMRFSKLPS